MEFCWAAVALWAPVATRAQAHIAKVTHLPLLQCGPVATRPQAHKATCPQPAVLLALLLLLCCSSCSWLFLAVPGCSWLFLAAPGCSWLLMAAHGCSWVPLDRQTEPFVLQMLLCCMCIYVHMHPVCRYLYGAQALLSSTLLFRIQY